ncbi:hypothetical protein [Pseudoclavibacter helvolus]|uniref:Uncharacterized protein n=1 Tax=Pseudoclavibacter helvolus TaxID=255205 RepID=A0A7W4YGP4_9MICO|nr:hypothetical protein [Pseudoclavibacter helvolus]MBB2958879.1 hypothetical protein [Pseudoclavibacter helvolus]MBB2959522.1 hypothetical protein [Pseudoclavibacter helvolus]
MTETLAKPRNRTPIFIAVIVALIAAVLVLAFLAFAPKTSAGVADATPAPSETPLGGAPFTHEPDPSDPHAITVTYPAGYAPTYTGVDWTEGKPMELVLPLVQDAYQLQIIDSKGNQVQQNAEHYTVHGIEYGEGGGVVMNASRAGWEKQHQLEDTYRPTPEDRLTIVAVDANGSAVDTYALNYVVLSETYEMEPSGAQTTTLLVEPNKEYTKGE